MTAVTRLVPRRQLPSGNAVFWFLSAVAYLALLNLAMNRFSYDVWSGLVIVPVLALVTIPVLRRAARVDPDPTIFRVFVWAFAAKVAGTLGRYAVTFTLYGERADATGYHGGGMRLAQSVWDGTFAHVAQEELPELTGTPFIRLITMLVYLVTGPTQLGGFIVFAWLSFWGTFLFYRACVIAFPEANHRRYAYLLFFLPTLLYWPSSLGKEAWMILTMGIATYGAALVLKHRPLGYPVLTLGLAGTAMVRPHVTVLIFLSLFVAYLLRRRSWRESRLGPVGKFLGVAILLVAGGLVVSRAAEFFELEELNSSAVDSVFERTERQSGQGGSEFTPAQPTNPAQFPAAVLAVLFRPFPWEANNAQAAVSSLEGMTMLVLFGASMSRLLRVPTLMFRVPYITYCLAFTVMFVFAFSSIGNFGIMTRQRSQVLPLLVVLLAIPAMEEARRLRHPELDEEEPARRPTASLR